MRLLDLCHLIRLFFTGILQYVSYNIIKVEFVQFLIISKIMYRCTFRKVRVDWVVNEFTRHCFENHKILDQDRTGIQI